jgi:hypothetical protein
LEALPEVLVEYAQDDPYVRVQFLRGQGCMDVAYIVSGCDDQCTCVGDTSFPENRFLPVVAFQKSGTQRQGTLNESVRGVIRNHGNFFVQSAKLVDSTQTEPIQAAKYDMAFSVCRQALLRQVLVRSVA